MESALQEDEDNIVPEDDSDADADEDGENVVGIEDNDEMLVQQEPSSEDEDQKGRIGQWISATTVVEHELEGEELDNRNGPTPPPTPIIPTRLQQQLNVKTFQPSRTPLFSIPEQGEQERKEETCCDRGSGEMAALSISSASDSNAFEMLGSPLPLEVCESADGVFERMNSLHVSGPTLRLEMQQLKDGGGRDDDDLSSEGDDLMQANTNKLRKPFRDPRPLSGNDAKQSNERSGGEGTTSLSSEEIRRKVATSFKKKATMRGGGSHGGKGKNQSKSRTSRNQKEIIKASTSSFWL
jgi:hypothetical protein